MLLVYKLLVDAQVFKLSNTILCFSDIDEESSHAGIIQAHCVFLLETLDVKFSGLIGHLRSKDVISASESEDVSVETTSYAANEKLLSVLSHKSAEQFQLFLDALDSCGQQHVRYAISRG